MSEPRAALRESLRRSDFLRATRRGRRVDTEYFRVFVLNREDSGATRLGITVTRKVGNAVRRNRIKRLVREWFRLRSRGTGPCDLVVIAKRELPKVLTLKGVSGDLEQVLAAWEARSEEP